LIGVGFNKGRWRAYIGHKGKQINLGRFNTKAEAGRVYDKAAMKYHGDKAKLNFGRQITIQEEQVYRLVSPDFMNLTYQQAAKIMQMSKDGIYEVVKRIKKKCPSLFPLCMPKHRMLRYEPDMDREVIMKF
jgi:predicted DNA-binding protein (UPF0251 family)